MKTAINNCCPTHLPNENCYYEYSQEVAKHLNCVLNGSSGVSLFKVMNGRDR